MQMRAIVQSGISCFLLHSRTVPTHLNTSVCELAHCPTRSCQPNVSPPDSRLCLVEKSSMPWCAIFLSSQCWSDSANFSHQECHFGTAGTDEVSTRAAALCPALWYLASHSRPSAPCMVLSLSVINISRSRDESVFVDAVGTSNLCQLALPHMIMCCRVGSSPRRSCSASSTSPRQKDCCSARRVPVASRTANPTRLRRKLVGMLFAVLGSLCLFSPL